MRCNIRSHQVPSLLLLTVVCSLGGASQPASAQDGPTIIKDSIAVQAYPLSSYRKNFDIWSWVPMIDFEVHGPIASGDQLFVEFTRPGGGPWAKVDCETHEIAADYTMRTSCGGRDKIPDEKAINTPGILGFAIKLRNPLSESGITTLFTGKAKVVKSRSNNRGPKAVNNFVFYVDYDWTLPIGYVYLDSNDRGSPDFPWLAAQFWFRGDGSSMVGEAKPAFSSPIEPHLLYQGKEVGLIFLDGEQIGTPSCGGRADTMQTSRDTHEDLPQRGKWTRVDCNFSSVVGWDKTGQKRTPLPSATGEIHVLSEHPGDYEIKILERGRLARSLKFTVAEDGTIVDNGIAKANKLGSDKIIVPVKFTGTPDGVWNKLAWKTDAFFGNPLSGFTWIP